MFPGSTGSLVGLIILIVTWLWCLLATKGFISFDFDAKGETGAFEKQLSTYLDIAKLILSLASGSVVLLVGSSALRDKGNLPRSFASPLFLLAESILYGILFMVFLTSDYEGYRHSQDGSYYTRFKYSRNQAFGYAGLFCFLTGYFWLIVVAVK